MRKSLLSAFVLLGILGADFGAYAQSSRHSNTSSLAQMSCKNHGGEYRVRNTDVLIGRQIYRGVARISGGRNGTGKSISNARPVSVNCSLAPNGSAPSYRTLNLAFGIAGDNRYADSTLLRLAIYRDGEFYDSVDISNGNRFKAAVDVAETRTISLEITCLRGEKRYGYTTCSSLWLTEDLLTQ